MSFELLSPGPLGAILHVNRQFIAMNAKDGGNRPVYTLKPNGPNSTPIYAREVSVDGPSRCVFSADRLACGAHAWIAIPPGTTLGLHDPMTFEEAKAA
jgi:hypothetical protein